MTNIKKVLGINVVIFSLVGLLHILRLAFQWPVQIGGLEIALWFSVGGLIGAAIMVYLNAKHLG